MEENPEKPHDLTPALSSKGGGDKKKSVNFFLLFELGIEFAFILALPLIGGVYLGKWLDTKYGTKFIIIIAILTALAMSWYMIYRKIKEVMRLINK